VIEHGFVRFARIALYNGIDDGIVFAMGTGWLSLKLEPGSPDGSDEISKSAKIGNIETKFSCISCIYIKYIVYIINNNVMRLFGIRLPHFKCLGQH